MAIVINGSTGITATESSSVLGDGAVEAADLASGAAASNLGSGNVTAAMLASTLDLTGKTVTLPSGTGGKVLQVVTNNNASDVSSTSTSLVAASGFTVSITPSSASNKILVGLIGGAGYTGGSGNGLYTTIYRNATNLATIPGGSVLERINAGTSALVSPHSCLFYDSPSSTSALTYQPYFKSENGNNVYFNLNTYTMTLFAMEIAA